MSNPITCSSRATKRQRTADDFIPVVGQDMDMDMAASSTTRPKSILPTSGTLPASFNGDLTTLPDFAAYAAAQSLPLSQIPSLPASFTTSLLAYAAARDPYIASILTYRYALDETPRQRARAADTYFSDYAQDAQITLYVKLGAISPFYQPSRGSDKAFQKTFDAIYPIYEAFVKVLTGFRKKQHICELFEEHSARTSYETRKNVLEAMIQIMDCLETALTFPDEYGDETGPREREHGGVARGMEGAFVKFVKEQFSKEELEKLTGEGVTERVRELERETRGYRIFERIGEVVGMLEGKCIEEEGEEEEEEV
ncbi:hypothetical protein B0T20DRAFT_493530 [Sordaria brevicollis]|uniref:Uncharacterized protein n=1 Tax=Sordaria brevicollis TaxID=83679 RepID=A0AAE0PLV0_SORBR|nr:hypothetical protein B0T20DRAFT_493530 [Sordaria brevicollis]